MHPAADTLGEFDHTVAKRKQRVVLAASNVFPGMEMGAMLADDDVARGHFLTGETLDPKALCLGIASVAG